MHHGKIFVLIALLSIPFFISPNLFATEERHIVAVYSPEPVIDGLLESLWLDAPVADGFVQIRPEEGEAAIFDTRVYIVYTDEAICVAFHCLDTAPDSVSGRIQRRDTEDESDVVYFQIDTFNDEQNAFFFGVTAGGVQLDGTFSHEDNVSYSWDSVWESAVGFREDGWVVEMKVPFRSFRHGEASERGWGINFDRVIHRYNEWSTWQPMSRQRGMRVNEFGQLTGLRNIENEIHFEILPHTIGRWDQPADGEWGSRNEWENFGIDLKLVPSSSWTLDLTYQPDFAQVDVDDPFINLSDYPVYLDEKRPFFLEGMTIYDNMLYDIFYSRKITNPDYGSRVNGSWGAVNANALVARNITDEDVVQNVGVGRLIWNLGRSHIGFTGTGLQEDGFHANTGAIDANVQWGGANSLIMTLVGVDRTGSEHQPIGAAANLFFVHGDHIMGEFGGRYKGEDFDINDLGFDGYSNVMQNWSWMQYAHFPEGGPTESMRLNLNFYHEAMPDGRLYEKSCDWNGSVQFRNNYWFGGGMNWGHGHYRERPDDDEVWEPEDYPLHDNFGEFSAQEMDWYGQWAWLETDSRKPLSIDLYLSKGTHREGQRREFEIEFEFRPLSNLEFEYEFEWQRIWDAHEVNDGDETDFVISNFKTRWSPSLNTSFRATLQFDREEELFSSNFLFAWNWQPGSWLYLVYDEGRITNFRFDRRHWQPDDRTIRMKWTWFFTAGV